MGYLKLTIDLLPKGAWGNDFSKILPKKDWDILREACYRRANYICAICGKKTEELDAHEAWVFDTETNTQTLKDIIALCSACHGVKHMRNSERIGYGEHAKAHFLKVNRCNPMTFASHYADAKFLFEERNKILRWKIKADLSKFGGKGIEIKEREIPFIVNSYEGIDWIISQHEAKHYSRQSTNLIGAPKIRSIEVNNYQGIITVVSDDVNKIEWIMDSEIVKTKFNIAGRFITEFSVENLICSSLFFKLTGDGGKTVSEIFELVKLKI